MNNNNNKTMNQKERVFGFIYVFLLFATLTAICSWVLFNYNSDFRLYSQKEQTIEKMIRIKQYQEAQNTHEVTIDSLYSKISKYNAGINAVYEENDIMYMINTLRSVYNNRSWDNRYKSFLHVGDFYYMWYTDKKELWSKRDNIVRFKRNLEDCEIGLAVRRESNRR